MDPQPKAKAASESRAPRVDWAPDEHSRAIGSVEARRAALEAQKRYMDARFGRDRVMGRKRDA
jgi:hypothetical protein